MPGNNITQRWQEFRPSKGVWLWSCAACIVLTMIIGFTAGGWVTGGTASTMTAQASADAREQLVASICVERFVTAPNAISSLTELKEARSWDRDDLIQDAGWTKIDGLEEQVAGAADICAEKLVAMDAIPARRMESGTTAGDTVPVDG